MKKYLLLFILMTWGSVQAQEKDFDKKIEQITKSLDSIIQVKSKELQAEFDKINQAVQEQKIDKETAETEKKKLAQKYADEIDYIAFKMTGDIKNVSKGKSVTHKVIYKDNKNEISYTIRLFNNNKKRKNEIKKKKRTYGKWFVNFGVNNVYSNRDLASVNDSPYGIWPSRYFSFGKEWKTSLLKKPGSPYFTYGLTLTWNTLKNYDNKYHVVHNNQLFIETYPVELKYSKLRSRWLEIPVGLELHIPNKKHRYLKLKAGGFAKINIVNKQKLKTASGNREKIIDRANFNINGINYGLFTEVGGKNWSVYMQSDALAFFKSKDWRLLSLGLKLEL